MAVCGLPAPSGPRPEPGTTEVLCKPCPINPGWLSGKITQEKASGQRHPSSKKDPHVSLSACPGALINEKTPVRRKLLHVISQMTRRIPAAPGEAQLWEKATFSATEHFMSSGYWWSP